MQEIIVLRGLPASGKTTWARAFCAEHPEYCRINKDDLRAMCHGGGYSAVNEALIVRLRDAMIAQALLLGWSVVVDDTNIQPYHLKQIQALAAAFKVSVQLITIGLPVEECIRRDAQRPSPVGEKVIRAMAATWDAQGDL